MTPPREKGPIFVGIPPLNLPPVIKVGHGSSSLPKTKVGIPVPSPVQVDDFQEQNEFPSVPIARSTGEEGNGGSGGDGEIGPIGAPDIDMPVALHLVEKEPQVVRIEKTEYPPLAVKAGIEGTVWVKILVDKEGRPTQTQLIKSTHEIFEEPALAAAKRFLFIPAYMTGGPVSVWISLPFRFTLK